MEYEYKILILCDKGYYLKSSNMEPMQAWFDAGWEYVTDIQKRNEDSAVGIILRKPKNSKDLI